MLLKKQTDPKMFDRINMLRDHTAPKVSIPIMMLIDGCVGSNSKQTFELTILMKLDCVTVLILFTFISEKSEILLVNYNLVKPFFF